MMLLSHSGPAYPAAERIFHILSGVLLLLGCGLHIWWNYKWFEAVFRGKVTSWITVIINSLAGVAVLIAAVTGFVSLGSGAGSHLHNIVGIIALVLMLGHAISHIPWMVSAVRKPTKKS